MPTKRPKEEEKEMGKQEKDNSERQIGPRPREEVKRETQKDSREMEKAKEKRRRMVALSAEDRTIKVHAPKTLEGQGVLKRHGRENGRDPEGWHISRQ